MVGKFASIIIIISLLSFSYGCDHFEEVPAYLQIDTIALSPASAASFFLTPSAQIVDAWITVDGWSLGGYKLPACVPVLKNGDHKIVVQAGVLVDNMAARRGIYPFYQSIELNVHFEEDKITNITFDEKGNMQTMVVLKDLNTYVFNENFEENTMPFDTVSQFHSILPEYKSTQDISIPTPLNLYGNRTIGIHLNKGDSCCIISKKNFSGETALPYNKPVFIEMDYFTNNTFEVGIVSFKDGVSTFHAIAGAGKQKLTEWNKLYIDISNRVTAQLSEGSTNFKIFIKASLNGDNNEADIYLDNVRLVF
jgi:hypothetical protein